MILFDHPRTCFHRRRRRQTAHLMSDIVGWNGTGELVQFARALGLKDEWIQFPGTEKEHYDLFDGAIKRAREAGATEVSSVELIKRVVQPKRAVRESG